MNRVSIACLSAASFLLPAGLLGTVRRTGCRRVRCCGSSTAFEEDPNPHPL